MPMTIRYYENLEFRDEQELEEQFLEAAKNCYNLAEAYGLNFLVLEIKIFPNRYSATVSGELDGREYTWHISPAM